MHTDVFMLLSLKTGLDFFSSNFHYSAHPGGNYAHYATITGSKAPAFKTFCFLYPMFSFQHTACSCYHRMSHKVSSQHDWPISLLSTHFHHGPLLWYITGTKRLLKEWGKKEQGRFYTSKQTHPSMLINNKLWQSTWCKNMFFWAKLTRTLLPMFKIWTSSGFISPIAEGFEWWVFCDEWFSGLKRNKMGVKVNVFGARNW